MDFVKTTNFIYEKSAIRIKNAIEKSGMRLEEIYPDNPKVISLIQNNRRDAHHNRYLITDTASSCLIEKLPFVDEVHLLWGDKEERRNIVLPFFIYLIKDCGLDSRIDKILQAYAAYARCRTYFKLLFQTQNRYPAYYYRIREDDVMAEIDLARYLASVFIYSECKEQIEAVIFDFMNKTKSFKKLPNKLYEFLDTQLIRVLSDYQKKSHAVGYRIEELILGDIRFIPESNSDENNVTDDLINATIEYMERLENIQNKQMKKAFNTTFAHLLDYDNIN